MKEHHCFLVPGWNMSFRSCQTVINWLSVIPTVILTLGHHTNGAATLYSQHLSECGFQPCSPWSTTSTSTMTHWVSDRVGVRPWHCLCWQNTSAVTISLPASRLNWWLMVRWDARGRSPPRFNTWSICFTNLNEIPWIQPNRHFKVIGYGGIAAEMIALGKVPWVHTSPTNERDNAPHPAFMSVLHMLFL